jgi:hypothetical protein
MCDADADADAEAEAGPAERVPTGWGDVLLLSFRPFGTPRFVSGWVFSATSACEVAEPETAC